MSVQRLKIFRMKVSLCLTSCTYFSVLLLGLQDVLLRGTSAKKSRAGRSVVGGNNREKAHEGCHPRDGSGDSMVSISSREIGVYSDSSWEARVFSFHLSSLLFVFSRFPFIDCSCELKDDLEHQLLMFGASVVLSRQADYLLDDALNVWGQVCEKRALEEGGQCARYLLLSLFFIFLFVLREFFCHHHP